MEECISNVDNGMRIRNISLKPFQLFHIFLPIACPTSMFKKFETNNNQVFNTFYVIGESAFINEISTLLRIF